MGIFSGRQPSRTNRQCRARQWVGAAVRKVDGAGNWTGRGTRQVNRKLKDEYSMGSHYAGFHSMMGALKYTSGILLDCHCDEPVCS